MGGFLNWRESQDMIIVDITRLHAIFFCKKKEEEHGLVSTVSLYFHDQL